MNILKTFRKVQDVAPKIDFKPYLDGTSGTVKNLLTNRQNLYYFNLAAWCDITRPRRVLELGTREGACALAISRGKIEVDAADINFYDWGLPPVKQVNKIQLYSELHCLSLPFNSYDLIFVDIDHRGSVERKIYDAIVDSGYKGVVFWDDIGWCTMHEFWQNLPCQRWGIHWHDPAGFGITIIR